ncbi:TRAP transporter small permease [Roseococcus sp. YIM B11640]|uniref:TRAP transporter small permease n=1 Tax=Roseococcus sp. YIM B11640 TaxID=3133973 RepID=UPI003C7B0F62
MTTALDRACRAALALAGVALVAMVGIVGWAVFGRFVLNDTPAWAEQVAMLLLGWVILGAAAAGVREGTHMGFDTLRGVMPAPLARLCELISDLVIMVFGIGMTWFGTELAAGVWDATLPTTGLPGGVEYMPVVLGGGLIALFGLERFAAGMRGLPAPGSSAEMPLVSDA